MEQKRNYSLFTAIAMIVGIVIGSGIFFKADDMLMYTDGDVRKAVLVFCIASFAIVFGGLCLSQLAALTDKPGGLVTYYNEFMGKRWASMFGWFQTFIYYPSLVVIMAWVVGIYISITFGISADFNGQLAIGFVWFLVCFAFNILSSKLGGFVQEVSLIIKLIPLFLIGITSMIFGDPIAALTRMPGEAVAGATAAGWLAAVGPVAFSFDGWVVSTSIAHEVKDSKRNMPLALIISPLFILAVYLMYFLGICGYVGAERVMMMGDEAVGYAASTLIGPGFAKIIYLFVTISIMGTSNGVTLGYIRIPYSLALRNALPKSEWLRKSDPKSGMPVHSALFAIGVSLVWWFFHWAQNRYGLLVNGDMSEISIVMSYALYVLLYVQVVKMWLKKRIKSTFMGLICPICATAGSIFIFIGGFANPQIWLFFAICLVAIIGGYIFGSRAYEDVR